MDIYTKKIMCKCFNCHSVSMEKVLIDYDSIKADMQKRYNDGFNDGYKKAKEEFKKKLDL